MHATLPQASAAAATCLAPAPAPLRVERNVAQRGVPGAAAAARPSGAPPRLPWARPWSGSRRGRGRCARGRHQRLQRVLAAAAGPTAATAAAAAAARGAASAAAAAVAATAVARRCAEGPPCLQESGGTRTSHIGAGGPAARLLRPGARASGMRLRGAIVLVLWRDRRRLRRGRAQSPVPRRRGRPPARRPPPTGPSRRRLGPARRSPPPQSPGSPEASLLGWLGPELRAPGLRPSAAARGAPGSRGAAPWRAARAPRPQGRVRALERRHAVRLRDLQRPNRTREGSAEAPVRRDRPPRHALGLRAMPPQKRTAPHWSATMQDSAFTLC